MLLKSVFHVFFKLLVIFWCICTTDPMNSEIIHSLLLPQPCSTFISFSLRLAHGMNWFHFVWFWQPCLLCNEMWCGRGLTVSINAGQSADCRARWRYSLALERSAHSDTTASVCAAGSLAVIYDASRTISLSLTLIQQFIYCHACIRAEVSFLQPSQGGGREGGNPCNQLVPHP